MMHKKTEILQMQLKCRRSAEENRLELLSMTSKDGFVRDGATA